MTGHVASLHAIVPVTFRFGSSQPSLSIEFVIDTGFTGYLTLLQAAVSALRLRFLHLQIADLADDTTIEIPVHEAQIEWDGMQRVVRVLAMGKRPLLGTALLDGGELLAQFAEGGLVTVDAL